MQTPSAVQTAPETAPEVATEFTPMPLRARGVLETLDLTIKVFRRYAGVLLAWSALVIGVCGVVAMFGVLSAGTSLADPSNYGAARATEVWSLLLSSFGVMVLSVFCFPLLIGAAACCVAGAVRGQRIKFSQCWSFTRPRYWSMLGQTILATLMLWIAMTGVFIVIIMAGGLSVWLIAQLPRMISIPLAIVAAICFYVGLFVIAMLAAMWVCLVPVIVCMEQNNRNSSALSRASALLRGNWRRAAGLMLLVWLGALIVSGVSQAPFYMFGGKPTGLLLGGTVIAQALYWLCAAPFYTLLVTLFYLDARVRNEALDLEWSSHTGTPQQNQNATAPTNFYPPVARAVSAANEANIVHPNASVWSASTEDLASMPLSAFSPQGFAPTTTQSTSPPLVEAFAPSVEPINRTQPLSDFASTNDISSTRYDNQSAPLASVNQTQPPGESTPYSNDFAPAFNEASGNDASSNDASSTGNAPENAPPTPFAPNASTQPLSDFSQPASETSSTRNDDASSPESNVQTPASAQCPQCGNEVSATQTFCMNCGARLSRRSGDLATGFGA